MIPQEKKLQRAMDSNATGITRYILKIQDDLVECQHILMVEHI